MGFKSMIKYIDFCNMPYSAFTALVLNYNISKIWVVLSVASFIQINKKVDSAPL